MLSSASVRLASQEISNAAELIAALEWFDTLARARSNDPHVVLYVISPEGFQSPAMAGLYRETLSDGSHVYNVYLMEV